MRKAYIDYDNGRALIIESDTVYKLEHDQETPVDVTSIDETQYLQPATNTIIATKFPEVPEFFPYEKLHERLRQSYKKQAA